MTESTQRERVLSKIKQDGYVDNFWAIENYILRLGAIIYQLSKKEGMVFERTFGKTLGKDKPLWKNFYYIYQPPKPEQKPLL